MSSLVSPPQKAAKALKTAENLLRNWQDDPNSPRTDVDKMIGIVTDLRQWVQAYVLQDIERNIGNQDIF